MEINQFTVGSTYLMTVVPYIDCDADEHRQAVLTVLEPASATNSLVDDGESTQEPSEADLQAWSCFLRVETSEGRVRLQNPALVVAASLVEISPLALPPGFEQVKAHVTPLHSNEAYIGVGQNGDFDGGCFAESDETKSWFLNTLMKGGIVLRGPRSIANKLLARTLADSVGAQIKGPNRLVG